MLYLPVSARRASRSWIYELMFILVTFPVYRSMLPDVPDLKDFIVSEPDKIAYQFNWTAFLVLTGADIFVFLVDLWKYSIWPRLTGRPLPRWQWWDWIAYDEDLVALEAAGWVDQLLGGLGRGEIYTIRSESPKGGPPSLAEAELTYFVSFVLMRDLMIIVLPLLGLSVLLILLFIEWMMRNPITFAVILLVISVLASSVYYTYYYE